MANENIGGKVVIILELPDGGIFRDTELQGDPECRKGDSEIVADLIKKGIEGTDWAFAIMSIGANKSAFTLKYGD